MIFVRPLLIKAEDVAAAVKGAVQDLPRRIPVQAVFMSTEDGAAMIRKGGVPTYLYPEDGAHALARVVRHAEWRRRPTEEPPSFDDVRPDIAATVIAEASGGWRRMARLRATEPAAGRLSDSARRVADGG